MSITKASVCPDPPLPVITIGSSVVTPVPTLGTIVRMSSDVVAGSLFRKVCVLPITPSAPDGPRAPMALTRVVDAEVPDCAVAGPSDVRLTEAGRLTVTTLPLLPLFCTIAAEPDVLPVLVSVRVPPPEPSVPSFTATGSVTTGAATSVIVVLPPLKTEWKVPLAADIPASVRGEPMPRSIDEFAFVPSSDVRSAPVTTMLSPMAKSLIVSPLRSDALPETTSLPDPPE